MTHERTYYTSSFYLLLEYKLGIQKMVNETYEI